MKQAGALNLPICLLYLTSSTIDYIVGQMELGSKFVINSIGLCYSMSYM